MKHTFFALFLLLGTMAFAQNDGLPSDELQIIKDFDAQVNDFDKVDVSAPLPQLDTTRHISSYSIKPKFLSLSYDAPSIKPILLRPKSDIEDYSGFLRVGAAYPLAPYIEAGHQQENGAWQYGGKIRYLGTFDWKQLEHQKFMDGDASLNTSYQFDEGFSLGGDIAYSYDRRYFYGYDQQNISFESKDIRQHFSTLKNRLSFKNTDQNRAFDYHIGTDFYYLKDNYNAEELGLRADGFLGFNVAEVHQAEIQIRNEWVKNDADTTTQLNVLSVTPSFTFHHDIFRVKAGVNTSLFSKKIHFYPEAEALAKVYAEKITVFAGWKGYAEPHSYKKMTDYNPYMLSNPTLAYKEVNYPYIGAKADFSTFHVCLKGGYKMVKNQAFFINNYNNNINRFAVLYDKANYITLSLDGTAKVLENINLDLAINYQKAKLDSLVTNSHDIADLDVSTTVSYDALLDKRLKIGTTLFFNSGKHFISNMGTAQKLSPYFDANIFADYRINKQWTTFLHLNNISHKKYQDWNGYRNYGFNALVGVFWKWK